LNGTAGGGIASSFYKSKPEGLSASFLGSEGVSILVEPEPSQREGSGNNKERKIKRGRQG